MADTPQPSRRSTGATARKLLPPPALCGFLLLLVVLYSVSYLVGSASGPVAPGMHGTGTTGEGGGTGDAPGGMEDMPGMRHGSGG
ncbi:hypothetical protein ACIQXA_39605 [Streptomyces massasporeus]|uniref:hypothetical protein n=1 Tax=Streptomyces massasporeus TaxID=67324 RepID=UPI0038080DED